MSEIWTAVYLFLLSPLAQGRGLKLYGQALTVKATVRRSSRRGVD